MLPPSPWDIRYPESLCFDRVRGRGRTELRVLRNVASEIKATLDVGQIFEIVLRTMDELFGERDEALASIVANQAASAIQNARRYGSQRLLNESPEARADRGGMVLPRRAPVRQRSG